MGDMWLSDRICDYECWEGKPPNKIHFVSDKGHFEYLPVTDSEEKKAYVGLDAENIRLRMIVKCLMNFFLYGDCEGCLYVDECDPEITRAGDHCKLMCELRALGIKPDDWR
jgi:hypothetical protein